MVICRVRNVYRISLRNVMYGMSTAYTVLYLGNVRYGNHGYPHSILYSMYTFYKRRTASGTLTSYGNITVSFYDIGFAFYRIDQYPHKGGLRWWLYVLYVCVYNIMYWNARYGPVLPCFSVYLEYTIMYCTIQNRQIYDKIHDDNAHI
jgi:hypothetical protein